MKFIKILLIFFVFNSCKKNDVKDIEIFRFDKELSSVDSVNIDKKLLKWDTSFYDFISYYYRDVLDIQNYNHNRLEEQMLLGAYDENFASQNNIILTAIENEFADFNDIITNIEKVVSNIHTLFPDLVVPTAVVTINAENSAGMMFKGDTIVLPLEKYLGDKFYNNNPQMYPPTTVPRYLTKTWDKKFIVRDILENWCNVQFDRFQKTTFLDNLIYKGKIMYIVRKCMPDSPLEDILKFSKEEIRWCEMHEQNIWNEILKMDIMYSSDESNYISFFNDSPFTRGMPPESPGRLGYFVGYKIISQYMENEDVRMLDLMQNTNSQEILLKSKYNPKKQDQESWVNRYWWISFGFIFLLGYFIYKKYIIKK